MNVAPVVLIGQTRELMRKWPQLWIPPLTLYFIQSLGAAAYSTAAAKLLGAICATAACTLLNLGWVAMLLDALHNKSPEFKSLPDTINRHWLGALAGQLTYYLLLVSILGLLVAYGHLQWGIGALTSWFETWQHLPAKELAEALAPERIPPSVTNWLSLLGYWLCITAGLTVLLSAWVPLMVLEQKTWLSAYAASITMVFRHMINYAVLAILHLLAVGTSLWLLGSRNPVATLGGLTLYLYANTLLQASYVTQTIILREGTGTPKPAPIDG